MMMSEINKIRFGFVQKPVIIDAPVNVEVEKVNKVVKIAPLSFRPPIRPNISKLYNTGTKNIEYVQAQVAEYYGISIEELIGRSRRHEYMIPRHTSITLCDALLPHSMVCIAKNHGDRDHATGINSRKMAENMVFTDPMYRGQFAELRKELENYFSINYMKEN